MGVNNLWLLLAPVGRQIEIETLATKVLAVDASIWLTQFIKAMRDDEGNMIKNAHLIGTFHRVAKLLFYRIRPVFVFDGSTPEIKRRTVARRRKRQEHQAASLRQTAQRILLNRLKLYREELKKNGGKPRSLAPAIDPNFLIPDAKKSSSLEVEVTVETEKGGTAVDDAVVIDLEAEEKGVYNGEETDSTSRSAEVVRNDFAHRDDSEHNSDQDSDDMTIDDIHLDTSQLSRIDMEAVFALPANLQKDMIMKIQRDRRQEVRDQFIPLAGNPEAYSRTQISAFLATSKLNTRIATARKKSAQREMARLANVDEDGNLGGHGKRIASSSDRFFIYEKVSDPKSNDDKGLENTLSNSSHVRFEPTQPSDPSQLDYQNMESEDDDAVFSRLHGKGRNRFDEDTTTVKRSLTDFSISQVKEFSVAMGRSQRRKLAVEEARRQLLEKQKYKVKEEPLAIENARQSRSIEDRNSSHGASGLTISIKVDDSAMLDRKADALFPDSIFDSGGITQTPKPQSVPSKDVGQAEEGSDDDVEWEDVGDDQVAPRRSGEHGVVIAHATHEEELSDRTGLVVQDEADSDVEWEDVGPVQLVHDIPSLAPVTDEHVDDMEATVYTMSEGAQEMDRKYPIKEVGKTTIDKTDRKPDDPEISVSGRNKGEVNSVNDSDEGPEDEDSDELFLSLKGAVDDEQAEEDLAALREEALKSAIATATNLTQWAAGAVRRALAPHTKVFVNPSESSAKLTKESDQARDHERTVDLSMELDEEVSADDSFLRQQHDKVGSEKQENQAEEDDLHLQRAIQESMQEQSAEKIGGQSRYLQYSVPTEPEPALDVEALEDEQVELKKLRNRQMRDVEGVNDEMVHEVMELLRLFGVPFLVCPMEAEAQCAALEQLGLVDGIITDDSDIFPFGGRKVYKNIFHNQKFVEAFFAQDVERELGFSQDEMISLALLLGSDYTDGIRGIGIVNATEVVTAYPGNEGLKEFKEWVQTFDVAEEARRRLEKKKSQAELDLMPPRERFQHTHAGVRRKWELGEQFPNPVVIQAYKSPQVDRSDARFSWELPDLAGLRAYCTNTFGWDQVKTDGVLLPLMEQIASFANSRHVQTRIDQFFTTYDDNVKYAKIRSKRLRSAVVEKTGQKGHDERDKVPSRSVSPAMAKKGKFTKTRKTTSTLGL